MTDNYERLTQELYDDTLADVADPMVIFNAWLEKAAASEVNNPEAMSVATVDENGQPDVRILLLKGCDDSGFVFYTNFQSTKAAQLAANPVAALLFHWKTLRRQVRVRGSVTRVSDAEADAYFASRPRGSQIGAHASNQSQPLANRDELVESSAAMTKQFEGQDVPRPAHWSGYRLVPDQIEFWKDGDARLHDRMLFSRDGDSWTRKRLFP